MIGGGPRLSVAAFMRYGRLGASSRVRGYQFQAALAALGCDVEFFPLLDNHYLRRKYRSGKTSWVDVAKSYPRRMVELLSKRRRFDVLFVEKELFPYWPAALELAFVEHGPPVVLDYDDAVWEPYARRPLLQDKIARLIGAAAAVTAGSRYLEAYARTRNDRVFHVPSVIDAARYTPRASYDGAGPVRIGWIGTPMTQFLLAPAAEALAVVARERSVRLVLVGAAPGTTVSGIETEVLPWREEEETERVRSFDVGIMPLTDEPFHRGKCGYKLVQYMGAGVPSVASPVGANEDVIVPGETGFLARTTDEWVEKLRALADSSDLREKMGRSGRRRVEDVLSVERAATRLAEVFRSVARA
ncbi:MAG: glycosyltransferase family 4 protein [Planctomycetota bacterium]